MAHHHQRHEISLHPDLKGYVEELRKEPLPPLLRPSRVAALLDMNPRRIYELVEVGELAAIRHGTHGLRILRESLFDWILRGGSGNLGKG